MQIVNLRDNLNVNIHDTAFGYIYEAIVFSTRIKERRARFKCSGVVNCNVNFNKKMNTSFTIIYYF